MALPSARDDLDLELLGRSRERAGAGGVSVSPRSLVAVAVAALLLLVAVPLAPFAPASPASAAVPGSVIELPTGFNPTHINEKGEVAGYTTGTIRTLAIWKPDATGGSLTPIPGATNRTPITFNDKGEILSRGSNDLEIWTTAGSRVLQKPMVAGEEKQLYGGWGPDTNNRTIATFGWDHTVKANAVAFQGSGSPTLITALSTVSKVASNGLAFGMLEGSTFKWAFLDGSSVIPAPALTGGAFLYDMSSKGHIVGTSGTGLFHYYAGARTSLPFQSNVAVNAEGALAGILPYDREVDPSYLPMGFRNPQGKVMLVKDIVGTDIFRSFINVYDMNDQCQILGQGVKAVGGQTRYLIASIPDCAGDIFKADLEISDGGAVVNREFELTLTVSSDSLSPVSDMALGASGVGITAPEGSIEVLGGPEPALPTSMGGKDSTSVKYRVRALKPGPLTISAVVNGKRNGDAIVAEGALEVDVKTAGIGGQFFRTDNKGEWVKVGEPAPVRLRVVNETGDDLEQVKLTNVRVEEAEFGTGAGTLEAQTSRSLRGYLTGRGAEYQDWADFELKGTERGRAVLKADVSGKDPDGEIVEATIETPFEVRQDRLKIEIELDPEEYTFPDDLPPGEDPEPLPVKSTLTFTNTGEIALEKIRLQDLDVNRTFSGQELYVTYKDGVMPDNIDPAILVERLEPGETSEPFITNWEATDDGEVIFKASATAVDTEGEEARTVYEKPWKAKPTKYLELTTEVVNPPGGAMLEAGTQIIVDGTVENLSNTASLEVGPLFPELKGNTGTMTVAYAPDDVKAQAPNPRAPVEPDPLELGPGEKKNFQVRITTSYSEARATGVAPSGGTRAEIRFEPWAIATELDGTQTIVKTYEDNQPGQEADGTVKATAEDLALRVSIDDSIEMPAPNKSAAVAAFLLGTTEGLYNAAIAGIYGVVDLVKMPVTFLVAAIEYQTQVWDSFTEEEKAAFLEDSSYLIAAVLTRNVEMGLKDSAELYDQVYEYVGQMLTDTQNEWQTGDFTTTAQSYGAFFGETIGSVAGPVVLNKMAQSPKAVAALERAQIAIQARMEPVLQRVLGIRNIEGVLPLLRALESGTELSPGEIETLYGVTAAEIEVYQQLATKYGYLLTIRSRHASSIRWIEKFGAMLKPEAIKIKSVSELDVKLGYKLEDLGSIVFKRPEVLKTLPDGASPAQVDSAIKSFVQSKGFVPGSKDHSEAVKRIEKRIKEWDKHAAEYRTFNEQGHIRTDFNYTGNGISDHRTTSERTKMTGFRMKETSPGSDEFVIELLDPKTGKYKRVTGDIDPIAFTKADGQPLTEAEHKVLVDDLMTSPVGAEHPESATYVEGGLDFILDQFKPGEPGLQIGPDGLRPRVVRFDKKRSYWNDERDYRLHWEGGFIGTSGGRNRAMPAPVDAQFGRVPLEAPVRVPTAIPTAVGVATVGRCNVNVLNTAPPPPAVQPAAVYEGADGILTQVGADGTESRSELHDGCFSEGAPQTVTIAPVNQLGAPKAPAPAPDRGALALLRVRTARAFPKGTATVELSTSEDYTQAGGRGFVAGQVVVLSAGTERAEERTIAGISGTTLVFSEAFDQPHETGDVIVMVEAADGSVVEPPVVPPVDPPVDPTDPTDPADPTDPPSPGTGPDGRGATPGPAAAGTGSLPRTGGEPLPLLLAGLAAVTAGTALQRAGRRRRAA